MRHGSDKSAAELSVYLELTVAVELDGPVLDKVTGAQVCALRWPAFGWAGELVFDVYPIRRQPRRVSLACLYHDQAM